MFTVRQIIVMTIINTTSVLVGNYCVQRYVDKQIKRSDERFMRKYDYWKNIKN